MIARIFGFAAVAASLSVVSAAQSSGGMGDEFVAYNRYAATGVLDEGTWLAPESDPIDNGEIRLLQSTYKASYRFTFVHGLSSGAVDAWRRAEAVWLYAGSVGDLGAAGVQYEVLLCANTVSASGESDIPGSVLVGPVAIPALPSTDPSWVRVSFGSAFAVLNPTDTYHVVVRLTSTSVAPDADHCLRLVTSRSRHRMSYMPHHGAQYDDPLSPFDEQFSALVTERCGTNKWMIKEHKHLAYQPVFLVEHTAYELPTSGADDRALFGNPYNRHADKSVRGNTVFGEVLQFNADTSVNFAAFLTGAQRTTRPCGDLLAELYETQGGTIARVAWATLIPGQCSGADTSGPFSSGRWHWFGGYFQNGGTTATSIPVTAGLTYYLALSFMKDANGTATGCSCTSNTSLQSYDSWNLPVDGCTGLLQPSSFPTLASDVPTFVKTTSYAFTATKIVSGASVTLNPATIAGVNGSMLWDAGFVLGNIVEAGRLVSLNDETGATACRDDDGRLAATGTVVTIGPALRNVGGGTTSTPTGEQFVRLVTPSYPSITDCKVFQQAIWNSDMLGQCGPCSSPQGTCTDIQTNVEMGFTMPSGAPSSFRYFLEFGWRSGSTERVDERVPFEIRRPSGTSCCP